MASKPTVFVGCSSEAKHTAELIVKFLSDDAYVTPWWSTTEFQGLAGTLDALLEAATRYDFAVFLLTPDDKTVSRGKAKYSTRDNVLFEAGLFLGAIGKGRVEILVQAGTTKEVKPPSDLLGVQLPRFDGSTPKAAAATIDSALFNFRNSIRAQGKIIEPWKLAKGYGFNLANRKFHMTLSEANMQQSAERIKGMAFLLAVRKEDLDIDLLEDTKIAISEKPRRPTAGRDLVISVGLPAAMDVAEGDIVEGHLLGVPDGFKVGNSRTIRQLLQAGAESIEGKGYLIGPQS